MQNASILIVDDDYGSRLLINKILKSENYKLHEAESGQQALGLLRNNPIDLVITDLKMEGMNGMQLLERVHSEKSDTAVIIITGYASMTTAIDAMRLGAVDYLNKPINADELRIRVGKALERIHLERKLAEIERRLTYNATVTTANHEINQPLTVILSGLDMLKMELSKLEVSDKNIFNYLNLIEKSSHRIAGILEKLRTISSPTLYNIPHGMQMVHLQQEKKTNSYEEKFILVIEDEEHIRHIIKAMLESAGYKVILTSNALEGLEVYKTQQQFIELIILDFHLPDFSGKETFQRLKQINHGSKIIITSGFEYSKEIQETINQGAMGFLRKPFNRDQIITTIQKIFRLRLKS